MAELLKEAIADAKAVREVALQNAKMALEEAFDSKIKNMLSAKLAEEIEEDVELEETYEEDEKSEGMSYDEDDKVKEASYDEDDVKEASYDEDGVDEEINLDELMAELEEMSYDEDDVKEGKDDEEVKEGKKDDEVKEGIDEDLDEGIADKVLGVAKGLGKSFIGFPADVYASYQKQLKANPELKDDEQFMAAMKAAGTFAAAASGAGAARRAEGVEESIDIDALIAEIEADLEEGKKDDEVKEGKKKEDEDAKNEAKKAKEELKEAYATVESLKSTISEMNLLNSKLLYCNKLFRANALTEAQKVKVVDALDKSTTTGEAKLVFETLQESFAFTGVEKRAIKEGLGRASKATGVAPTNVITESVDETVSRFQKLANINK